MPRLLSFSIVILVGCTDFSCPEPAMDGPGTTCVCPEGMLWTGTGCGDDPDAGADATDATDASAGDADGSTDAAADTIDRSCPPVANAIVRRVDGMCVPTCVDGFADCDDEAGCETATGTIENCGGRGDVCEDLGAEGVPSCEDGRCTAMCGSTPGVIHRTTEDLGDCDGVYANGCETDFTDSLTCGSCDAVCAWQCAWVDGRGGVRRATGNLRWRELFVRDNPK